MLNAERVQFVEDLHGSEKKKYGPGICIIFFRLYIYYVFLLKGYFTFRHNVYVCINF
jgi:hypothetical protein